MYNNSLVEFSDSYCELLKKLDQYDSTLKSFDKVFAYGTSGFRFNESELDKVKYTYL